jgi:diadenosine tetraphosphate (Ap4A) HIT family hydrolase
MPEHCMVCDRLGWWRRGENPYFIAEFTHSVLVVGDHQYHRGYCVLLLKDHVRDLHELPPEVQAATFADLMRATDAIVKTFQPDKMNHACLGNAVPHNHWHLMPRYASDPNFMEPPFTHAAEFKSHMIDAETARKLAAQIRANLS